MSKGIKDDEVHYDQANQIEDSIHALARKFDSALPLVQPTERPHEQEKRNGDTLKIDGVTYRLEESTRLRRTNRSPLYVARLHPLISRTARSGSLSRSVVTRQKPSAYWASWRQPELNRPGFSGGCSV